MAIWSDSPHMPEPKGTSATQNTSVGSGSRPTKSRFKIETSAPDNARMLDGRGEVPGALGMGKKVEDVR
jgi:hypothetical protein